MQKKNNSITDIVKTVYCEQKFVFDRTYGDKRPEPIKQLAEDGVRQHTRFEKQGKLAVDRRCFVATAVFGAEAEETNYLRQWRDEVLLRTGFGRLVVRVYYYLSPKMLWLIGDNLYIQNKIKAALTWFINSLKRDK